MVNLAVLTLLPFLLLRRVVPPEFLGLLVGVYGYAGVMMDLLAGVLSDWFAPERLAIAGSVGVMLAVVLLDVSGSVPFLVGARLLHGIAMGSYNRTRAFSSRAGTSDLRRRGQ